MKHTKTEIAIQNTEVEANYQAFKKVLPELMKSKHKGQYALMHKCQVKEFIAGFHEAVTSGNKRFKGKPFSVQKVDDKPVHLGIHSIY